MEVVGYAASSTDEHGGRRIGRYVDENALLWLVIRCSAGARFGNARNLKSPRFIVSGLPEIDFMSRLAKRPLAKRGSIRTREKSAERLLRHFCLAHRSPR